MRTTANGSDRRCAHGLNITPKLHTRCILVPGHGGNHEAKTYKKYPYARVKWYSGDERDFITDRRNLYAWTGN